MTSNKGFCDNKGRMEKIHGLDPIIFDCIHFAYEIIPHSGSKLIYRRAPDWNIFFREKFRFARVKFMLLHDAGRIRFGLLFEERKFSRAD